jgi:tRNA modification GTPase
MVHRDDEIIVAQCSPQGRGAIGLIRITGKNAVELVDSMSRLASGKRLQDCATHTIHYGTVRDVKNQDIDTVLFLLMRGPSTFTGQDTIEITCHNNQFIIQHIIMRALECGARSAQEGEFSRRSYLNGKVDLVQAEAINELINAHNQQALKRSLSQLKGSLSSWIESIVDRLVRCLALSEASFEFIDEDMEFGPQIKHAIEQCRADIKKISSTFDHQQQLRQGIKIALIGSVNAGKSSLFNALLKKDRAIVTPIAGTTRDVIESGLYVDGYYWTLVDTAGLRQTDDVIEQQGIERSMDEAVHADIVLLVYDGSRVMTEQEKTVYDDLLKCYEHKLIIVHNKSDMNSQTVYSSHAEYVSSKNPESIEQLHEKIQSKSAQLLNQAESPFLLNQRQITLLRELETKLEAIVGMLDGAVAYELLSYHLQEALSNLTELTGKTISEEGMDKVFREFCIGK